MQFLEIRVLNDKPRNSYIVQFLDEKNNLINLGLTYKIRFDDLKLENIDIDQEVTEKIEFDEGIEEKLKPILVEYTSLFKSKISRYFETKKSSIQGKRIETKFIGLDNTQLSPEGFKQWIKQAQFEDLVDSIKD